MLDVYNLGYIIRDTDGPAEMKRTLVWFVRHDPWLSTESMSFVRDHLASRGKDDNQDPSMEADDATDHFIHRATRLAGKTPIQLLIERQHRLSDHQRQRLLRWDRESFMGVFQVKAVAAAEQWLADRSRAQIVQRGTQDVS